MSEIRRLLWQLEKLDQEIKDKELEHERLQVEASQTTRRHRAIVVKSSRTIGRQEEIMATMADLSIEIDEERLRLIQMKRVARRLFRQVDDPRYRRVLCLKYLCALNWKEIADRMNYSTDWVFSLHRQAVSHLEKTQQ